MQRRMVKLGVVACVLALMTRSLSSVSSTNFAIALHRTPCGATIVDDMIAQKAVMLQKIA